MQHRTFRTLGASVVLIGVAVAGIVQVGTAQDAAPTELVVDTTAGRAEHDPSEGTSTSAPEPFVYRLGTLTGVTTDNFWAYYGEQPSVWNSYILGPTKPALFTVAPETGALIPELALETANPTWDRDGWRVRVSLDPDFRWSDGTAMTAEDIVFTFETVRELGLGGSWANAYPTTVESVSADGEHELRIEFTERPKLAVWPHGIGLAPVMARHIWSDIVATGDVAALYAAPGSNDVSGGPLSLITVGAELIVSQSNPGYPENSVPDKVEYHIYPDEDSLVSALRSGEIDALLSPKGISPDRLSDVDGVPGVTTLVNPAHGVRYLGFNLARAPMSDLAFRRALALIFDRAGLASSIAHSGEAAWSIVPEANARWYDTTRVDAIRAPYQGDLATRLATALQGLRDAGYAWEQEPAVDGDGALVAGTGLTIDGQTPQPITILTPGDAYDPARPRYVEEIAAKLVILGFDARPVETDFDTVVDLAFTLGEDGALHYDMYLLGWTLGSPTLPDYHRPLFAPDGAMNNTGYVSESFNRALARYEAAYSREDAATALWDMETILAADLPYLPLYTSQMTEIYRSDRVSFGVAESLGGLQGRLGGIGDVEPVD